MKDILKELVATIINELGSKWKNCLSAKKTKIVNGLNVLSSMIKDIMEHFYYSNIPDFCLFKLVLDEIDVLEISSEKENY